MVHSPYLMQSRTWDLDRRGNWNETQTTVDAQSVTDSRLANGVNEYTQQTVGGNPPVLPGYDGNGRLLNDGQRMYGYDEENRLISVVDAGTSAPILDMLYDALGNRVVSLDQGTTVTVHVPRETAGVLEEYDDLGNLQREFVYGLDAQEPLRCRSARYPGGTVLEAS